MKFEEALPLMRKGIVCTCDGVSWTVNEKHEWLRWYGTSFRIDSGPSNDQILGGEWEREGGVQTKANESHTPDRLKKFSTSNAPPTDLSRFEARLRYLEILHDVVHRDDGPVENPPSYRQIMKHTGDLWRDE